MPNSRAWGLLAALVLCAPAAALAQQAAQGFALERLTPAAPGAGWFMLDNLDMRGPLGGALAVTGSFAADPLRVGSGAQRVAVVSREAFLEFAAAVSYGRWRAWLALDAPVALTGSDGSAGGYDYGAPHVNLGNSPDVLYDPRLGLEARLVGDAAAPFRLGLSAELLAPSGDRSDYVTDGTLRGIVRALAAGQRDWLEVAGSVGTHLRWRNQPAPGGPRGSELLFGIAAGARIDPQRAPAIRIVVGPELFGETAWRSAFSWQTTGIEAMLTGRIQWTTPARRVRAKLGAGGGIDPNFGAPVFRMALSVEMEGGR
jgi:hypothetical protein